MHSDVCWFQKCKDTLLNSNRIQHERLVWKKTIGFASVGFHESSLQNSKMVKEIFKNDLLIVLVKI